MAAEEQEKIQSLIYGAFECHLNLEEDEYGRRIKGEELCDLCILKDQLNQYECIIFDKVMVDNEAEGTWNPRLEEKILRCKRFHIKVEFQIDQFILFCSYHYICKKRIVRKAVCKNWCKFSKIL